MIFSSSDESLATDSAHIRWVVNTLNSTESRCLSCSDPWCALLTDASIIVC